MIISLKLNLYFKNLKAFPSCYWELRVIADSYSDNRHFSYTYVEAVIVRRCSSK